MARRRAGRPLLVAAGALVLAFLLWAAWGLFHASGAGRALGFLAMVLPLGLFPLAFHQTGTVWLTPGRAAVAALVVYFGLGLLYGALNQAGYFAGSPLSVLLWPTLLLWQDACVLGLWPCPAG
jgi:hypothetical protein